MKDDSAAAGAEGEAENFAAGAGGGADRIGEQFPRWFFCFLDSGNRTSGNQRIASATSGTSTARNGGGARLAPVAEMRPANGGSGAEEDKMPAAPRGVCLLSVHAAQFAARRFHRYEFDGQAPVQVHQAVAFHGRSNSPFGIGNQPASRSSAEFPRFWWI